MFKLKKTTHQVNGSRSLQSIALVGTTFLDLFVVYSPCESRPGIRINGNVDDSFSANHESEAFEGWMWLRWIYTKSITFLTYCHL